jgi:hypothetical protein
MLECLNTNAAAIQAVGSVLAILVAILVAGWQTRVSRRDQADARRRAARVLAMELLPTVTAVEESLACALIGDWEDPQHWNVHALQERRIVGPDVLERALDRLAVLDDDTIRPILGTLSALRDYHRAQSQTDMRHVTAAELAGELRQRRGWLDAARRHAAEAVERLSEVARPPRGDPRGLAAPRAGYLAWRGWRRR